MNLFDFDLSILLDKSVSMLINLVVAILIFFIGKAIAKKLSEVSEKLMEKSKLDETLIHFLGNVLFGVLMMVVIMASLNRLGVDTTSLVAIIGGASVAIGLALKDQLSNFAAGVLIILFRPFNKGDYIKIGDNEGTVSTISLITTSLTTVNNHEVIIPNNQVTADALMNYSSLPNRRIDMVVGIGYNSDIKTARSVMLEKAEKHSLVFSDPAPTVIVKELNSSSVDLELRIWTTNDDWRQATSDLREEIKYAFDECGIEIPFPQRVVHMVGGDAS